MRPQAALSLDVPVGQLPDTDRSALAQELGYKTIGKELPDHVTLTDIIKTMPKEVRFGGGCRKRVWRLARGGVPQLCSRLCPRAPQASPLPHFSPAKHSRRSCWPARAAARRCLPSTPSGHGAQW